MVIEGEKSMQALTAARADPVVLLGRGGGGTRLLSEGVEKLGVFLGNELNGSRDSVEWVDTIYGLSVRRWGAHAPEAGLETDAGPKVLRACADEILHKAGRAPAHPWGWKLPETTLIAPIVAHAFPHARCIHLVRHPVTACCRRSHVTSRTNLAIGKAALGSAYDFLGRERALMESDPQHIKNAASWAFQADIMLRFFAQSALKQPHLTLTYEDMCNKPDEIAERLSNYLGLPPSPNALFPIDRARATGAEIDPDEAQDVWDICAVQARQFGYSQRL